MKNKFIAGLTLSGVLLTGCTTDTSDETEINDYNYTIDETEYESDSEEIVTSTSTTITVDEEYSEVNWSGYSNYNIILDNDESISTSSSVTIDDSIITISETGIYTLNGTLSGGSIVVDGDDIVVKIILDDVNITSADNAAIYVASADLVVLEAAEGTTNYIYDSYTYSDDEINGTIYSKDDLVITGTGTINVVSNGEDAIVSKDYLMIENVTLNIESEDDGIRGKDYVVIDNATINIDAGGDGIKSTVDDDEDLGFVVIADSIITINAEDEGIQAGSNVVLEGNTLDITTNAEGSIAIKADNNITIESGTYTIDASGDAINSGNDVIINGGTFTIEAGDDGIHADDSVIINDGNIEITNCYEGIESTVVQINGGDINIYAEDDGVNAIKISTDSPIIEINGGTTYVEVGSGDTDTFDSNGDLTINGGTVYAVGPTSTFDVDGTATINGGTVYDNGTQITSITISTQGHR